MAIEFYFSPLGHPSLGLTAANFLLEAYERDLRVKGSLTSTMLEIGSFSNMVLTEYANQCLINKQVEEKSLPASPAEWSIENFDKFPALRIIAIQKVFDKYCLKTKTPPPSYTTRTFAKPDPGTSSGTQKTFSSYVTTAPTQDTSAAGMVDSNLGFLKAMLEHLAQKTEK